MHLTGTIRRRTKTGCVLPGGRAALPLLGVRVSGTGMDRGIARRISSHESVRPGIRPDQTPPPRCEAVPLAPVHRLGSGCSVSPAETPGEKLCGRRDRPWKARQSRGLPGGNVLDNLALPKWRTGASFHEMKPHSVLKYSGCFIWCQLLSQNGPGAAGTCSGPGQFKVRETPS